MTAEPSSRRFWEGEYDLILFVCGLQPWEKEDSLRAIRFLGAEEGLQILLNHRKCGRDYLPEEVRHLRYLRLPFLTPPFDAGGRRGQENEAAEETEFFERIFREAALQKRTGDQTGSKRRGTLAEHPAKVGALYGWIPVAVEIGGNTD